MAAVAHARHSALQPLVRAGGCDCRLSAAVARRPVSYTHLTGLVLVTHHLGDILPEIERVVLMRAGRIVADGPRVDLLTEARLSALFRTPVRIGQEEQWLHSW